MKPLEVSSIGDEIQAEYQEPDNQVGYWLQVLVPESLQFIFDNLIESDDSFLESEKLLEVSLRLFILSLVLFNLKDVEHTVTLHGVIIYCALAP